MSTRCIGCKREIAKKQKDCYICGSSQNYLSHYSNNIIAIVILIVSAGIISNKIVDAKLENYRNTQLLNNQESVIKFDTIKSELNKQISNLKNSRYIAQSEIEELKASIAVGSSSSSDTLKALEKEKARSKWLSRENWGFSSKIKELTNHIARLEKQNTSLQKEQKENISTQSADIPKVAQDNQTTAEEIIEESQNTDEKPDSGI
ncbi:MAG: hypothetical protein COA86_11775 [Kangiella sp.]|nr:MAG: hypothetical protein COA86_11775 [Kangiella sp.]